MADARSERESLLRSLLAVDRAFAAASAREGVEAWVAYFRPDGRLLIEGGGVAEGAEAIRAAMGEPLSHPTHRLRWQPTHADVSADGTLGFTNGRWELVDTSDANEPTIGHGKYLTVWRREDGDQWLAVTDIGHRDPLPNADRA